MSSSAKSGLQRQSKHGHGRAGARNSRTTCHSEAPRHPHVTVTKALRTTPQRTAAAPGSGRAGNGRRFLGGRVLFARELVPQPAVPIGIDPRVLGRSPAQLDPVARSGRCPAWSSGLRASRRAGQDRPAASSRRGHGRGQYQQQLAACSRPSTPRSGVAQNWAAPVDDRAWRDGSFPMLFDANSNLLGFIWCRRQVRIPGLGRKDLTDSAPSTNATSPLSTAPPWA